MFFVLSKLLGDLVNPATLLGLLVLSQAVAWVVRCRKCAAWFLGGQCVIVLAFGFTSLANLLAYPLEARFPLPTLPADIAGLIILGGTERVDQAAAWGQPALSDPMSVATLVAFARRYPKAKLVFSGGWHSADRPSVSEASIIRDFVAEIAGPSDRLLYEQSSRNTYENAIFSYRLARPAPGEKWLLICQAIGLPRAVGVFRKAGWNVVPYPAGYLSTGVGRFGLSFSLLPSLDLAAIALHEWAGLFIYYWMGYTDTWLPE